MSRPLIRIAAVLLMAAALAGCGKKGAPMVPKDEPNFYPHAYPSGNSGTPQPAPSEAFPSTPQQQRIIIDPTQPRTTE